MTSLQPGERCAWPPHAFRILDAEMLLISTSENDRQDHHLFRINSDLVLPGLDHSASDGMALALAATRSCRIEPADDSEDQTGRQWLSQQLFKQLHFTTHATPLSDHDLKQHLLQLHHRVAERLKLQLDSHQQLDARSERQLFRSMEAVGEATDDDTKTSAIPLTQQATEDPLVACLSARILHAAPTRQLHRDPRQRLQQLLNHSDLFGRDVLIDDDALKRNCGNLIGFLEDQEHSPVLLQSTHQGYRIWAPAQMKRPAPLEQHRDLLKDLNPRMVSIHPAFQARDLSTIGLLRFAYGRPSHTARFVIGGLLLGLIIGFALAIGRDVGAARWIFGMGATGALAGTSLGLLSGGFRIGVGVMLLSTLLGLLTPTFNTVITNQALPDQDLNLLLQISVVLVAAGITRVCLEWVQSRSLLLTQQEGAAKSQMAGMQRLLHLPTDFFRRWNLGDLQLRFGSIEQLRDEIQTLLEGGLIRSVLTSIYILFMLRISVKLTMLALVVAALILGPTALIGIQSRPLQRKQEEMEGQAQSRNLELINSVSKLRLAGAEVAAARWWGEKFQTIVGLENSLDEKEANATILQTIMPNLGMLLIYIVVTRLIAEASRTDAINAPNAGQLLGFFSAFGTFIGATTGFAGLLVGAFDMPIIYERARPILDSPVETEGVLDEAATLEGEINFDRVSYRYSNELPLVLDNVSFKIHPGEHLAIVGPSGSGKSTIIRLLLGFSSPENGEIRYDGQPLNGLRIDSIRRQIGTVLQNNILFSGTLIEAIAGGSVIDEAEAWQAAEMAGLADEIRKMPMGLQTVVSEGGGTLSGGQRQRVAIARALVRRPRVLIFDEATSALDNRSQAVVTESLDRLSITRIVVAHRLSTIRHADRIIVLDQGQVREEGTFDALMNSEGLFCQMMQRQIT